MEENSIDLKSRMKDIEKDCIIEALKHSTSVNSASKKLGINRTTLVMKLKSFGINPYNFTFCHCNCHKSDKEREAAELKVSLEQNIDSFLE